MGGCGVGKPLKDSLRPGELRQPLALFDVAVGVQHWCVLPCSNAWQAQILLEML